MMTRMIAVTTTTPMTIPAITPADIPSSSSSSPPPALLSLLAVSK